jgi:hypothetical protein
MSEGCPPLCAATGVVGVDGGYWTVIVSCIS